MKNSTLLRSQVIAALALALLLALFVPAVMAQSAGTSGLTGTVSDPSGAAIPNVTVTLTSNTNGQSATVTTGYRRCLQVRFAAAWRLQGSVCGERIQDLRGRFSNVERHRNAGIGPDP